MSDKLGFTFYPKDWWSSDSYFSLDAFERYVFLECLFLMYTNGGYLTQEKTQIENRIREQIKPNSWEKITQLFTMSNLGYSLPSVNKRLKKAVSNRLNGQKGGRPPSLEKPKKPNSETQKNPPLEREREEEREIERESVIEKELTPTKWGKQPLEILKKNCSSHQTWLESIGMKNSQTIDQVVEWFNAFCLHLEATNRLEETEQEFKRYCASWIASEIRQGRKPINESPPESKQKLSATQAMQNSLLKKYGRQNN
ncbi:hypothetical protein ACR79B_20550 [Sphingobacterium spiritivorum]|uniref:DUF7833 domain-containing protein n=1 Tax=Sphingobacterium spiritivorum TaxID=258 RepID=UPI003DA2BAD5